MNFFVMHVNVLTAFVSVVKQNAKVHGPLVPNFHVFNLNDIFLLFRSMGAVAVKV